MRSASVAPPGVQQPRVKHAPSVRANAWEDVSDVAKAYGLVLDEWQENVLEAAMGERSDGKWATPRVGLSVPRQNGKGSIIEARELAGLLVFGEKSIVHSAHQQATARVGFDRLLPYFENYDDLRRRVKQVGTAVAREYIQLKPSPGCPDGQMLRFPSRSKGMVRGFSIDLLILDEAQVFGDAALQAVMPTMSARDHESVGGPQMWLLGTPPTPLDDGTVFTRWRDSGLEGRDRRLCWVEWSAEEGCDPDDHAQWALANPALGIRVSYQAAADEREALDDAGFRRERLGLWSAGTGARVIPLEPWKTAGDVKSFPVDRLTLAVEAGPDLLGATMMLAGKRDDGSWHVSLEEQHEGVDWVGPMVAGYVRDNPSVRAVVVDLGSPTAALVEDRHGRWFLKGSNVRVIAPKAKDLGVACSSFLSGVVTGEIRHTDQPQVNAAAGAAGKRPLGDTGMWVWSRKTATSDITPVQAATLALWGAQETTVARPSSRSGNSGRRRAVVL